MVRFGIQVEPQWGFDFAGMVEIAREAERAGFDSLWVSDHLFFDARSERRNCLEAWTVLAALAPLTTRLRLGTLVTCNSYRPPSLLAKIAASVDQISGGRLEFGIGAGWKKLEYLAYGYDFPRLDVRVAQLEESLEILKKLWSEERASLAGRHYRLEQALSAPKPVQRPLKIWIGGSEEQSLLPLVARHADGWNMPPGLPLPVVERKLAHLRRCCEEIGRDFTGIEKSLFIEVCVVEDDAELAARAARFADALGPRGAAMMEEAVRVGTAGTAERVAQTLRDFQRLGFDYFVAMFPYLQDREMLLRFSETVMPRLS